MPMCVCVCVVCVYVCECVCVSLCVRVRQTYKHVYYMPRTNPPSFWTICRPNSCMLLHVEFLGRVCQRVFSVSRGLRRATAIAAELPPASPFLTLSSALITNVIVLVCSFPSSHRTGKNAHSNPSQSHWRVSAQLPYPESWER